jgi:hypothetical protein
MKKVGQLKVYIALLLLIVLVAIFPYKEGFDVNDMFSLSWFTTKKQDISGVYLDDKSETKGKGETKDETKGTDEPKFVFNDKYGSGLSYTNVPYDVSYNQFNNLSNL